MPDIENETARTDADPTYEPCFDTWWKAVYDNRYPIGTGAAADATRELIACVVKDPLVREVLTAVVDLTEHALQEVKNEEAARNLFDRLERVQLIKR